jgi:hypothetical protein
MTPIQIYRRIIEKYLRLKPDIVAEIEEFYNSSLRGNEPLLAVHVRGTDKIIEVANLSELNKRYHIEIKKFLDEYNVKKIFVFTDSKKILEEYKSRYGDLIISTDCNRGGTYSADRAPHLDNYINRRRKGIEVIKDTYLATKCDYFIGNGYSNVSFAVNRLKDWPAEHITLFYNTLKQEKKLARRRKSLELLRRRNRAKEHRLYYPELYGGV